MTAQGIAAEKTENEMVITRVFDAPRDLLFQVWTDPKHVEHWWGPRGFTNPVCELDVRPGGSIRIDMRGPDGTVYPMTGVYQEIIRPERIVFTSGALDKDGQLMFEVLSSANFTEHGGKTTLTLRLNVMSKTAAAAPHLAGMEIGWSQTLDRLAEYLAKA